MNCVEPIRNKELILDIGDYLKDQCERDYVLFMTGIYLGRRIGDMLQMKVRDVRDREYIYIKEQKTGKRIPVFINKDLKKVYRHYCRGKKDYEFLFRKLRGKRNEPIGRVRAWQILNDAANAFDYKDGISCHVLRKTFGYWLYEETGDVVAIQELLGHSDPSYTKRYIGVNQSSRDKIVKGLNFMKK